MGYQVDKFEIKDGNKNIPVAIHTLTEENEISYAVSLEGYENFEIKCDAKQVWTAEPSGIINPLLLAQLIAEWKK